ncbi:MAG: PAS domain S-box protein [Syntrophobacter sp.]
MFRGGVRIYRSLISRLIVLVGLVLFVSIFTWAYFNIEYQKKNTLESIIESSDRLGNTIRLGTHYAMMLNSREDLNEITKNIGRQEGIENIRIYNKEGQIKFSSIPTEIDKTTSIKAEACDICHRTDPPLAALDLPARTRIFNSPAGYRLLGIISPIYNEPSCASEACHVHPQNKKVLGALDVVVSLKETDRGIKAYESRIIILAVISFLATSAIIVGFLLLFVNRPIKKLITWTRHIARGEYDHPAGDNWDDEIGQMAQAIDTMSRRIAEKQEELNRQRHEYQELFEQVPCYITVQDENLRLLRYNREFVDTFDPGPGDYCYEIYKGKTEACAQCPVLMTFRDGVSHLSEEMGVTKNGNVSHWICRTSPLRDSRGNITAVMEMSIDITELKALEEGIRRSEKKYREIFNNIPNPIFVLDRELRIIDCNDMVTSIYGYEKKEILHEYFRDLFEPEGSGDSQDIKRSETLNHVRHVTKDGRTIYVNIRISPSEYLGGDAFLVTTSDITQRLMAEQHLIQTSKMATLGEMATGIAHELNQPLSVMKTASSFIIKKIRRSEPLDEQILRTMAEEIDSHVDRASGIINHLREFGRKSEVQKENVDLNEALEKALAMFLQQLKLRAISVEKDLQEDLPPVLANSNRLEQVFINLLINARDAIEDKCEKLHCDDIEKKICLKTCLASGKVQVEVADSGIGIPASLLDKIFEPFFTTKRVGRGTGLGLSISYGILQDYDATIRVETHENEGANFILRFPTASEA